MSNLNLVISLFIISVRLLCCMPANKLTKSIQKLILQFCDHHLHKLPHANGRKTAWRSVLKTSIIYYSSICVFSECHQHLNKQTVN